VVISIAIRVDGVRDLHVANLRLEVLQLFLDGGVFLGHLLVLRLPLVTLLLEGLHFTLEVSGFDISLTESADVSYCRGRKGSRICDNDILIVGLSQVLIGLLSLLLQQLQSPL
jgi:hypothetical protein